MTATVSNKLVIYSDGGARGNPGPSAIGVLICNAAGEALQEHMEVIGEATNNIAEYTAVIVALELAKKLGGREIDYYVDSELVARQISGQYKIKAPHIRSLYNQVMASGKFFSKITFTHVPRTHEKLRYVDRLVNQALDEAGF